MKLFIIVILIGYCCAYQQCYAPPMTYGPQCKATQWLYGSEGDYIEYSVTILGNTNIQCKATGAGYEQSDNKPWGWYDIGVLKDGDSGRLYWGSNAAYPSISCKGLPLGSGIQWEWSVTAN